MLTRSLTSEYTLIQKGNFMIKELKYEYNDGGRKDAGYKGKSSDCVTRAIAIATGQPYKRVYGKFRSILKVVGMTPSKGIPKEVGKKYLKEQGWKWKATMGIGTGCKVHLRADELPSGSIICSVSRHLVAVIDGVIQDTFDCSRDGKRCVYGYWYKD